MIKIGIVVFCIIMVIRKFAIENIQSETSYGQEISKHMQNYKRLGRFWKYKRENRKNKESMSLQEWLVWEKEQQS